MFIIQFAHCLWHRIKNRREAALWCSKKDPEVEMSMLDYIVDCRRCERKEVEYYETFNKDQCTAKMFMAKYPEIFKNEDALESLRFYMSMTMLLKLASIPYRQIIMAHPMWQVRYLQIEKSKLCIYVE